MKKILFIDDGIEFDSITAREKSTGGAESAFVSLAEAFAKKNYEVCVYNNCKNTGLVKGVNWKRLSCKINDEKFNILILNRGDKFLNFKQNCKNRIFWIHNPATYLLKLRYIKKLFFNPAKIIFSSNYHLNTYPKWAPSKKRVVIPYGIQNFIFKNITKLKVPQKNVIFTSNPERGLDWLLDRWENDIYPKVPDAKLNLFTGLKTYGDFGKKKLKRVLPVLQRAKKLKNKGVILNKPVKRQELVKYLKASRLFLYQGSINETFCMSVAEAQVLGIPTVVKNLGCLAERVSNQNSGYVCDSDKEFSSKAVEILTDNKCWLNMHKYMLKNNLHYSWQKVAEMWEKNF